MEKQKLFHKDFILVVIGQIISLFGNGIVRFALPLYLLTQTGSAALFGIVTAASFLPLVLLIPVGGIVADRVNKRNIMVALDFSTATLMFIFFLLFGKLNLVVLIIVTLMLLYGIQGAYTPAVQASMPLLHGKENLLRANAIINQVDALSNLLAPIIGGILFGIWGLLPIIIVGGICFFISAVMEIFIKIPYTKSTKKQSVFSIVRQDLSESFIFISKEKPIILKCIYVFCAFNLFLSAMMVISMPVLITQTLKLSNELYGYSQGALAAGALLGAILVGVFANKLSIKKIHILFFFAVALLLPIIISLWIGLPAFISYLIICISCFLVMAVATMATIQILSFIQSSTPTNLTGKVLSLAMALSMCSQPLGQAMYGFLFDAFKTTPHIIVLSTMIVSGVIALLSKKVFNTI